MMDWRPGGWKGLSEHLAVRDVDGSLITLYIPPERSHREKEIYEAGADKLFEYLTFSPGGCTYNVTDNHGLKGKLKWIPDADEG